MFRRLVPLLCLPLLACAVGPRYATPHLQTGGGWTEAQAPGAVPERWWLGFDDAELTALIDQAVAASPDLKAADARLAQARAARAAARGQSLPQGGASAAYSRNRVSANGEFPVSLIPGFVRDFNLFDGGFDASWEVDLWGRQRKAVRAAGAREEAAAEARRDTLIRLRAEVARTYLELRAAQARLAAARTDAAAQAEAARLAAARLAAGEASRPEAARAEEAARSAAGAVPLIEADVRAAAAGLADLTARPPETMAPLLAATGPLPEPPAVLAPGLRSDVLRRRPDVRGAERTLAAATSEVGVAVADLFPRLTLAGTIGQQSQSLSDIALAGSTRFEAGPQLVWPILQRGTIRANIRAAGARADEAGAAYEGAVFAALADSETALSRFARTGAAREAAEAAFAAARQAREAADERFAAGEDDAATALAARSHEAQASERLTEAKLARAEAAVAAFKALGL